MDELQKKKKSQMDTLRSVAFIIGLLFSVFLAGIYDIRHAFAVDVSLNITIERISAIDDFGFPVSDPADFYAVVTIDGNEFDNIDTPGQDAFEDDDDISPNWEFSRPIDLARGEIPITIRIFDEDGGLRGDDDEADIDDGSGRGLELSVPLAPCQVSGDIDATCGTTLVSSGRSDDRATVRFKIDVTEPPGSPGLNVGCLHDPVWPQPGGSFTITASSLGGLMLPRTADSIEIWVNERTGPAAVRTGTTTLTHTVGPVSSGTVAYGCRVVDDGVTVFSGWRLTSIGPPQQLRAVPIVLTGWPSSSIDILLIADRDSYASATDPGFLSDIHTLIGAYYSENIFSSNQDQLNFWLAQDMGDAESDCEAEEPQNWLQEYIFVDAGAIIHRDEFRDCSPGGTKLFSSWINDPRIFLHESGHRHFGLADEYCCDGGYFQTENMPNLFEEPEDCAADDASVGRPCREFIETVRWWFDFDWYTSDPPSDDLMVDNLSPQLLDARKISSMFDLCASAGC